MPGAIAQDASARRLTLTVVLLAALLVYLNPLANGFAWGDDAAGAIRAIEHDRDRRRARR